MKLQIDWRDIKEEMLWFYPEILAALTTIAFSVFVGFNIILAICLFISFVILFESTRYCGR